LTASSAVSVPRDAATAPARVGAVVSPGRRAFGIGLVAATLFLIYAGAEVKSRDAGLAVPDWPLSYGKLWPKMVGNVYYEHGHRSIAAPVGLLTAILAFWTQRTEPRSWVRGLAWAAFGAVVLQGLLGGLTVIHLLPAPVSMAHGTLAQLFLCLLAWLAYANSREWLAPTPLGASVAMTRAQGRAGLATAAVFVQLLLGAWMRHIEAGLAVPFFPVSAEGRWLPEVVDVGVVAHMLHRGFAFVVLLLVWRAAAAGLGASRGLRLHSVWIAVLVSIQVCLGASVVWVGKAPVVTSVHVVSGAALLMSCWLLTLRCWRAGRVPGTQQPALSAAPLGLEGT